MNKKGFTLIELLAVIVILAIIALIATPIVLNIISDSKESAGLRSAEMYLKGVEQAISLEKMTNTTFNPNSCTIANGNLNCDGTDVDVKVNGEVPESGSITFESGKITDISLKYENDKVIIKDSEGNLVYKEYKLLDNYKHQHIDGTIEDHEVTFDSNGHGICSKCNEEILAAGLYKTDGTFVSWEQLTSKEYQTIVDFEMSNEEYAILNVDENGVLSTFFVNTDGIGTNYSASYLEGKLVIDDSITSISDYAFFYCYSLEEVVIPGNVKIIGQSSFNETDISKVTLSEGIEEIGSNAFNWCYIESINLPNSIKKIGVSAIVGSYEIKDIYYNGTKEEWNNIQFSDSWYNSFNDLAVHCTDGDITYPANVER